MNDREAGSAPGLYVHVPFCVSKCRYCDFFSVTSRALASDWLAAVDQEARLYKDCFATFDTLYLGGGTPTCLHDSQLTVLFDMLRRHFSFAPQTEVTIEANPDDLSPARLEHFASLGVNRLSLGVQSFSDLELQFLGRRNSARQNHLALHRARSRGGLRLAVDLIYGLPGQTLAGWLETLRQVLQYRPEHLSCYQLTVEAGTPLAKMREKGLIEPLAEDAGADYFLQTSDYLAENGYEHYEISNFSRERRLRSRHNCKYWRHTPYLGLGPGAHSFRDGVRWWNVRSVEQYCQSLQHGRAPLQDREQLSTEQLNLEALFLGLRTADGIPVQLLGHSPQIRTALSTLQASGLVTLDQDRIVPSQKGFAVADSLPLLLSD